MHTYPTRADARMVLASLAATALLAACGNNEDSGVARGAIVSERTVSTVTRAALDASTAASGVQLLSGTAKCDVSVRQITYATPGPTGGSTVFTPMVVTGFQRIYGNLYTTPTDYYKAPYVTGIESLLPGATPFNDLYTTGKLPLNLSDLLTPRAIADVSTLSSGLRRALDQNSLLGWKPAAPVLLCAGSRDPVVLYQVNTARSAADIASRGGSVTAVDVETVPAFAAALPPANATATQLAAYHGTTVPPLCMKVVRDNLFAALR